MWWETGTVLRRPHTAGPRKTCGILAFVLVTRDHWRGEWKVPSVTFLGRSGLAVEWCLQQELGPKQESGTGVTEVTVLRDGDGLGADGRG